MTRNVPARLHVLLARDTAAAVVIRRGPSRHTALVGWNRKNDTFQFGQWLHGRIYERRSDLSPDGKYLIYFAMNGRWASNVKGAWSAISRAPYLKAISLFPKGDCWHGGGLFLSGTEYWLNDGYGHEVLEEDHRFKRVAAYPWHEQYGGECPGVYYIRLQRDGWKMRHAVPHGRSGTINVFEKRIGDHWALRKLAHATLEHSVGRGAYFDTHELVNERTGEAMVKDRWEWADVDGSRLVWAENGCLYAGRIESKGLCGEKALFDFTPMKFEKLTAPY